MQHNLVRVLRWTSAAVITCGLLFPASVAAAAKPKPGRNGFRLFASAVNVFAVNRVQCRVFSDGTICATGSSTVGGGIWPRGTADQYVFGSGVNIAGIIEAGDRNVNGFAGDTAGAFFNNTAGGNNGEEIRPIFDSNDPADAAVWPDEARVPCAVGSTSPSCAGLGGDATGDLFDPALQGSIAASQGDLWFVNWEGNASRLESRAHPMGVVVETRALGWNFPQGNEDIIYFLYTFYNITSTNEADYANVRPSLRPLLLEQARSFHATNTARFGINLPAGGYAINDLFASFVADMDVANANSNYATVNVPFALGITYDNTFGDGASLGWTFPPAIFGSAPFFPGFGFIGVKYLGSPDNPDTGEPVGLTLFGTFSRSSGSLQDPRDEKQLYRYLTGGLLPTDGACSLPNPLESKICFVNISSPADMRFFQSSGPVDLPPGGFGTIVVAYIFAAPVASGGCPGAACDVKPANNNADLTILGDPARMANGVNKLDTMMGYAGNINGLPRGTPPVADPDPTVVTQDEFLTVPGSLLRKAQTAQSVFDNRFLLPFAPERPEFFLVPGNNQVTILWARSATETSPDPFFAVASDVSQALYDPNFRGLDVEGYRIYRGRVDNPAELQLMAQFDYVPDPATGRGIFTDFRGLVNPTSQCAPELGVFIACDPALQPPPPPGTPFTGSQAIDLTGTITQLTPGSRVLLASGEAQTLPGVLDTAFTEIATGRVAQGAGFTLANTGVPFLFIDRSVRNSLRYFYSVTAFDLNSLVSGPSSLESARVTKAVIPAPAPSNQQVAGTLVTHVIGNDGVAMDTIITEVPSFNATTGQFGGRFPPADGGLIGFVGEFATSIIQPSQSGALTVRLNDIEMGRYSNIQTFFGVTGTTEVPTLYHVTVGNGDEEFELTIPHLQAQFAGNGVNGAANTGVDETPAFFEALVVDQATANRFEGAGDFRLQGQVTIRSGPGQEAGGWGVSARFADFGPAAASKYNGSRWFDGPSPANNETVANPQINNCTPNAGGSTAPLTVADCGSAEIFGNFNNAGALTGVTTIQQAAAYMNLNGEWRNFDWIFPTVRRAADFNVTWGPGGTVASVFDVTHNVAVPFRPSMGGGWGILNASAGVTAGPDNRGAVLTVADLGCVEPFATGRLAGEAALRIPCASEPVPLSNTAELGPVAFFRNLAEAGTVPVAPEGGFLFYLAGDVFLMSMPALPAEGTVWSLRSPMGTITGGPGAYTYSPPQVRPFTAIGATSALQFGVTSTIAAATSNDLGRVHTVPDPYYVKSAYEASTEQKVLKFVGLPARAIIRIYSVSGVLVRMLEHDGTRYASTSRSQGSEFDWDLRNRNNQVVASGVYFYHVEAGDARRVGRFTVVNFAQ